MHVCGSYCFPPTLSSVFCLLLSFVFLFSSSLLLFFFFRLQGLIERDGHLGTGKEAVALLVVLLWKPTGR